MIPVFADTFYYVAFLNAQDSAHEAALALASRPKPILTTSWVLTELANAMSSVHLRGLFIAWYEKMRTDPNILVLPPTKELLDAGIALYSRHRDKDWSLTDCISFLVMRKRGIREALTGDHHFEQAGFRALLR